MRKSDSLCLFFFVAAQGVIFFFLKKYHSFSELKWLLVGAEAIVAVVTAWWYLLIQPPPRPKRQEAEVRVVSIPSPLPQKPDDKELLLKAATDEKKALAENVKRLEEVELFSKQRLHDLEQEKSVMKDKLKEAEGQLVEVQKKTNSFCQTIQELTFEVDRLLTQLEQERRQHSIEVRTLLKKEGDEGGSGQKKKSNKSTPAVPKVATPPLPSLLLLLSTCQKGLDLHQAQDWPANEYRLLVRRKFFDTVQKMNSTPLAVVSLEYPAEYFLSSKLPQNLSINEVRAAVLAYKTTFERLQRFEPFHFTDEKIGGRWIGFRAAWENLDDIITIAPTSVN